MVSWSLPLALLRLSIRRIGYIINQGVVVARFGDACPLLPCGIAVERSPVLGASLLITQSRQFLTVTLTLPGYVVVAWL